MSSQIIKCPSCGTEIALDDVLTHQIEEKVLAEQRTIIEATTKAKLQADFELTMKNLVATAAEEKERNHKLTEQLTEIMKDLRRAKADKEDAEIMMQKKLSEESEKIRAEVRAKAVDEYELKAKDKDKKLADLMKQVEEMKIKMEQGSQQSQGEVLELEIEDILRHEFPTDEILPVGKGVNGADIHQQINTQSGVSVGLMMWEIKRTKTWTEGWVQKLKDDQREKHADLAILVTTVLPKGVKHFGQYQGIWISDQGSALGLALALRESLIQIFKVKNSQHGLNEKMEVVYNYLSGVEFKQKIEAIVESFTTMKEDLSKEKLAFVKIWEKRDKQISRVMNNTVRLHGDLEGLMGKALPKIEMLELE